MGRFVAGAQKKLDVVKRETMLDSVNDLVC